jgi:hypothetical protein
MFEIIYTNFVWRACPGSHIRLSLDVQNGLFGDVSATDRDGQ